MAPSIKGLAAYKKKDGTLTISKDQKSILWQPLAAENGVNINVVDITSMSQLKFDQASY